METKEKSREKRPAPRQAASQRQRSRPAQRGATASGKVPAERATAGREPTKRPAEKAAQRTAANARPATRSASQATRRSASRPVSKGSAPAGERPAPGDEVYVPDEKSQRVRHADPAEREAAPRRRSAQPEKAAPRRSRDAQYRPYHQANQQKKAQKKQSFRENAARFFSSRNPLAKVFYKEDPSVFGDDARTARREKRAAEEEKKRRRAERMNTPAAIYTQPVSFNSRRLAIQLTTILAVVLALVLGMSAFFKVENIAVVGTLAYDDYGIAQVSGIQTGDNLLTINRTRACGKIVAEYPYVKSARIGIKLPDTVIIEIEESPVVYSIQDNTGVYWLINSDGKVVEQSSATLAEDYTNVRGVELYMPQTGEPAVALEDHHVNDATEASQTQQTADASAPAVTLISGAQKLNAALEILRALEKNDIVGTVDYINVSQYQDIILWYDDERYQVNLGAANDPAHSIEYKINYMKNAIMQMSDYQTGVLDVSFTTWPDKAGYTPFG